MAMDINPGASQASDWEARQKLASFYQTQIGIVQQAAIASQAVWATLAFTVGLAMTKLPDVPPRQVAPLIFVSTLAWLFGALWIHHQFQKRVERIWTRYTAEHRTLFSGIAPYPLECPLLEDRTMSATGAISWDAEPQAIALDVVAADVPVEREEEGMR